MVTLVREPKTYQTDEVGVSDAQPGFIESLKLIFQETDKSALYLLLATFFFMVSYTAVEGFFTLYALRHVGLTVANGTQLLGLMSLAFVVFAIPSGHLGAKVGRRLTIVSGLLLMGSLMLALYFLPVTTLRSPVFTVPVLGAVPVLGVLLMFTGIAWAFIIIHPLPMLSDMTSPDRIGTYTGLYYLFTSLAAIVGPNINGWIVQLSGQNYNAVMLFAPLFLAVSGCLMLRVRKGESRQETDLSSPLHDAQVLS
jgi:MFS family permease